MTREEAYEYIIQNKGKLFSVIFIKRTNNETRKMLCRLGVTKYLKGGDLPYNPKEKNLLAVFDMQKKEYRMINFDTLLELKIKGQTYKINN